MIDQAKKRALIERIKRIGFSNQTETLLTVEEYFDGYDADSCMICANNTPSVSTSEFRRHLAQIRSDSRVHDVYIRFYDFLDAEKSDDCWINSDMVFLVTTATPQEVEQWFAPLQGDEAYEETDLQAFVNPPVIPDGYRLVGIGWD